MKAIKIITIILLVVIISLVSFLGIYKKDEYRVSNIMKDYTLGMEFTDSRVVNFEVNKEENNQEKLTLENYKLTKSIIKNRLKNLGVDQYRVVLDETTGNIQVRIQENEKTNAIIYYLLQPGTFELKDSKTEEILIDTSAVKNVNIEYAQGEKGTKVNLQIKLNKESKQKLEEISKIYVGTINQEETESKIIKVFFSGIETVETSFEQIETDGIFDVTIGESSNSNELMQYDQFAQEQVILLNSGALPITYTETDNVETSKITTEQIKMGIYVALGAIALITIIFVIGLKTKGLLAAILQIGFIASLLLTLRYTNVKITIEGICGIVLASIINFVYIYKGFKNADLNFVKDITGKFALRLIPVYIIAIILSFNRIANIYSLGMTLVWGIIVMYLYNLTATQITIKALKK